MPKLRSALKVMARQDPSISYEIDDNDQITLKGMGKFHIEISVSRLQNEHKIKNLVMWPVQVEYRESPVDQSTTVYETLLLDEGDLSLRMEIDVDHAERQNFSQKSIQIGQYYVNGTHTKIPTWLEGKLQSWFTDAVTMGLC